MTGDLALDTTAAIAVIRKIRAAEDRVRQATNLLLPVAALGELIYGAYHSDRPQESISKVFAFAADCTILVHDAETAEVYGRTDDQLARIGRRIPMNDLWIAACCLQHNLPLLARDAHYDVVPGLVVEKW
jgi:tRNA(fMet)-specific endonuclease VapC